MIRDTLTQTKYYFFQIVKGTRFVFFAGFYGFSILFFNFFYRNFANKNSEIESKPEFAESSLRNIYQHYIYDVYHNRPKTFQYINEIDPIIVISFTILFFFLPFYMLIITYPALSEESQRNSIKYLLQYTNRTSLFLSKLLAVLLATIPFILAGLIITYFANVNTLVPVDTRIQIWLLAKYLVLVIPYIVTITAMVYFCSAVSSQTYTALGLGFTVWMVLGIAQQFPYLKLLSPFFYEDYFFALEPLFLIVFTAGNVVLTALFLIAGYLIFLRKEFR